MKIQRIPEKYLSRGTGARLPEEMKSQKEFGKRALILGPHRAGFDGAQSTRGI